MEPKEYVMMPKAKRPPKHYWRAEDYGRDLRKFEDLQEKKRKTKVLLELEYIKRNTILGDNARLLKLESRIIRLGNQERYMRDLYEIPPAQLKRQMQEILNKIDTSDIDDATEESWMKDHARLARRLAAIAELESKNLLNLEDLIDLRLSIQNSMDFIHLVKNRPAEIEKIRAVDGRIKNMERIIAECDFLIEEFKDHVEPIKRAKEEQESKGNNNYYSECKVNFELLRIK